MHVLMVKPTLILGKFEEVYMSLYNSAETKEAMDIIKNKLKATIGEVSKVTAEVVQQACCKMKADMCDVSGALRHCHFWAAHSRAAPVACGRPKR